MPPHPVAIGEYPPLPLPNETSSATTGSVVGDDEQLLREYRLRLASKYQSESEGERNAMKAAYEASLRSAGVPMPIPIISAIDGYPSSGGVRMMMTKGKDQMPPQHPYPPNGDASSFCSEASTPSCYQFVQGVPQPQQRKSSQDAGNKGKQRQSIGNMTPTVASQRPDFVPQLRQLRPQNHTVSPMSPASSSAAGGGGPHAAPNNSNQSSILRGGTTPIPGTQSLAMPPPTSYSGLQPNRPHCQEETLPRTKSMQTPRTMTTTMDINGMPRRQASFSGYRTTSAPMLAGEAGPLAGGGKGQNDGYWFPNAQRVSRKVAFSQVQKVQESVKQRQYTTQFPAHIAGIILPGISAEGYSYLDYTHDEAELCEFKPASMERLLALQGRSHHVRLEWCGMCELQVNHRKWAWSILTAIMRVFPDLDYLHSLPSELCTKHHSELFNPAPHRSPQTDCKEMALVFKPRGGIVKRIAVIDAAQAVSFIRNELETMPPTNLGVTLLNARGLESRKSLLSIVGAKNNPYVVFSLVGVETHERESQFVANTTNPDFGLELFTFRIVDPVTTKLKVDVYSHDKGKKREKQHHYGSTTISLHHLKIGEAARVTVELNGGSGGKQEVSLVLMAEGSPFIPSLDENGSEVSSGNGINRRISYRIDRHGQATSPRQSDTNTITPRSLPSTARSNRSQGTGGDLSARPGELSAREQMQVPQEFSSFPIPMGSSAAATVPALPLATTPTLAPSMEGGGQIQHC